MPIYLYECPECQEKFEVELKISQYDDPQKCPSCGIVAKKIVSKTHFILKGDGWSGKNIRIKRQMRKKNEQLDRKSRERPSQVRLVPNVEGERTESWAEARKLAASKKKDTSSFDSFVEKEKRGRL